MGGGDMSKDAMRGGRGVLVGPRPAITRPAIVCALHTRTPSTSSGKRWIFRAPLYGTCNDGGARVAGLWDRSVDGHCCRESCTHDPPSPASPLHSCALVSMGCQCVPILANLSATELADGGLKIPNVYGAQSLMHITLTLLPHPHRTTVTHIHTHTAMFPKTRVAHSHMQSHKTADDAAPADGDGRGWEHRLGST